MLKNYFLLSLCTISYQVNNNVHESHTNDDLLKNIIVVDDSDTTDPGFHQSSRVPESVHTSIVGDTLSKQIKINHSKQPDFEISESQIYLKKIYLNIYYMKV